MNEHVCTVEECGWKCWPDDSGYLRDVHITTDWGDIDGEGPCHCELHDG